MTNQKSQEQKLKLKLKLKKETLRELNDSQMSELDQVVGGTCTCSLPTGRSVPVD